MRRLLTGGIKAILAIAALSTAAHWALRVQREPAPTVARAPALPEPTTTGSIEPRKVERPSVAESPARGLDQQHLGALIASHSGAAKVQKTTAKQR
ncbi:hypothetical protein [Methylobacterium dankookense]|uniref:Uncharacterized protein n=1 Tax=Methylobacterium dankookense TaxID=560405 RepID=A0A564FSR0_9HYPH|nr:hypothetical protein [Methylobacterium dankookense]GJD57177.1 hypothetical protein IFDJLNFL_3077 [Methylobacterium dankookense]VUF10796.1 hypothetical protein MTDSW087_00468 [Methylobacterium dankookense]